MSFTDASNSGWGATVSLEPDRTSSLRDYWTLEESVKPIVIKEALALLYTLKATGGYYQNSRVNCRVDNLSVVQAWKHEGCKNKELSNTIKDIYKTTLRYNIILVLSFVPSQENTADLPSRVLTASDAMLAQSVWKRLEAEWGPHTIDLMALDSNTQKDQKGPWPTVNSAGINVFAQRINPEANIYVFPLMALVGPLIRFQVDFGGLYSLTAVIGPPASDVKDPAGLCFSLLATGFS